MAEEYTMDEEAPPAEGAAPITPAPLVALRILQGQGGVLLSGDLSAAVASGRALTLTVHTPPPFCELLAHVRFYQAEGSVEVQVEGMVTGYLPFDRRVQAPRHDQSFAGAIPAMLVSDDAHLRLAGAMLQAHFALPLPQRPA